tara:strand:+ start:2967 stop:4607 length:1641 start_codon:yes stop_codon:yes gene_type:complete
MKYLLSFLILTLLSSFDFYNPKGFNYQAIVRDASGNIKKNANVNVAFDILDQSDNVLYSESHTVTTNDFGVINLVIGEGSTSDDFSIVDWSIDELSIKVTLDGTVMGTSPLLSVPYANYANNGITSEQAAAIEANTAKVGVYTDDSDNTVAGAYALNNKLGIRNTAIGKDALRGNKDGGDYNTAIGYYSLRTNTTGTGNTALGNYSLQLNTEGKNNTASGKFSLQYNTTGDNNTAMGSGSLNSSTEANNSSALGYNALKSVTTGNANTSVGATAGDAIVTGIQNTVMGYNSGGAVTSGGYNVLIGANAGSQNSGTTKKAIIGGSNNTLVGTGTAVDLAGATNRTVIGKGAIGKVNNSVTLGNSSVTDVYAADDGDATVHAKGITFSDGTTQTTAAVASESKVTFNQVITTSFTDTENVLEIGDLVIRVNENYLEWKVNSGEIEGDFYATVIIQGSRGALWGSMNSTPNVGDNSGIKPTDSYQQIVDITDNYTGGETADNVNNPGLWYYKMVEIELINNSYNESYKITAYGNGTGKVTMKGEYWNFK